MLPIFLLSVNLVWNDAYSLYPPEAHAAMSHEVESVFERSELDVRMHVARKGRSLATPPGPRVNVVVNPGDARGFGLDARTMAVAVGERTTGYTIFVFLSVVRSTLGHAPAPRRTRPRELSELARAVGRVVSHELIHVLAPERGHARSGLMARTLTRRMLLRRTIELDPASRHMARDRLRRWSPRPERTTPGDESVDR